MSSPSLNKLANELKRKYSGVFENLLERTLGARLGELNKGDASWWDRHPEQLRCVLEHLALTREDLAPSTQAAPYEFLFREFPDIPPLDFRKEEACEIGRAVPAERPAVPSDQSMRWRDRDQRSLQFWLGSAGIPPRVIQWLQIEDAVEREMLVKRLSVAGRHEIIARQAMDDLIKHHGHLLHEPTPLIVSIQRSVTPDTLEEFAGHRRNDAPRLIISPFPPPLLDSSQAPADDSAQEKLHSDSKTETEVDASHPDRSFADQDAGDKQKKPVDTQIPTIDRWVWVFKPGWRRKLLEWVGTRLVQTKPGKRLDVNLAYRLLERFDSEARWLSSVSDLLSLCRAIADEKDNMLEEAMAQDNSANRLVDILFGGGDHSIDLVRHLVRARWADERLDWVGGIPKASWTAICPDRCDADKLIARGIITAVGGGFDFAKPVIARLLLRDHLVDVMEKGELAKWAPACFDSGRRPWLDAALDALRSGSLERMGNAIRLEDASAGSVGAREALFSAIGRRLIRNDFQEGDYRARSAFISEVLPHLAPHPKFGIEPLSRPPMRKQEGVDWIAVCWAWSLAATPVDGWAGHWLFPGWSSAPPAGMMDRLSNSRDNLVSPPGGWDNHPEEMSRLFKVAAHWMGTLRTIPDHDPKLPVVFRMALLAHAAAGKWEAEPWWWLGVLTEQGPENALWDWLRANKHISELDMARRWWPSLVAQVETRLEQRDRFQVGGHDESDQPVPSLLYREVCQRMNSSADEAIDLLGPPQRALLCAYPQNLTPALKRALLRHATANGAAVRSFDKNRFLARFGVDVADELDGLTSHPQIGGAAAWHLWAWRPNLAKLMMTSTTTDNVSVANLIRQCGFDALDLAIDRLRRTPSVLSPEEREQWIRAWLPDARQHADALFALRKN